MSSNGWAAGVTRIWVAGERHDQLTNKKRHTKLPFIRTNQKKTCVPSQDLTVAVIVTSFNITNSRQLNGMLR